MIKNSNFDVGSTDELVHALTNSPSTIRIHGVLKELNAFTVPAGCSLQGVGRAVLQFKFGQPGVSLSANTRLSNVHIETDESLTAVSLADEAVDLGEIHIHDVSTVGRFHLEATQAIKAKILLRDIHVQRADARMAAHRPAGYGVEVLLGVIAVYNACKNAASQWQLLAENLSCGSPENPVRGSGVFVFGGDYIPISANMATTPAPTQAGGQIQVKLLSTGEIHSDGGISAGTPNLITGGVFLGCGVNAVKVQNDGAVTTYGVNDMVLDNWGRCEQWVSAGKLLSLNTSGIGFVNFGEIADLQVLAPIETRGLGARGFNLYDGKLQKASFHSIKTSGDGAIGIQLSKPFGSIVVLGDIHTTGGEGESLVRGKIVHLKAHGLSFKPGTQGDSLVIKGQVIAEGQGIEPYDFAGLLGSVARVEVHGQKLN